MLEVGKLYICEEYYLLLYPDRATAATADAATGAVYTAAAAALRPPTPPGSPSPFGLADPASGAAFWTRELGKSVLSAKKNIPILSLNNKEKYVEVLAGDRKGWIIVEDWLGIKEIQ